MKTKLEKVYEECLIKNWDGGAYPITKKTYDEALKMIYLLPPYIETPEIYGGSSGEIFFEWRNNDKIFIISMRGINKIVYYRIFNPNDKISGIEEFDGVLPEIIVHNLNKLYS